MRHLGAADPREMVEIVGHDLDEMTVAVDDRMAESILDLLGPGRHHDSTPSDSAHGVCQSRALLHESNPPPPEYADQPPGIRRRPTHVHSTNRGIRDFDL
jgi:hypothetical protein